ncbi:MAG: ribulose-phosphate 3-epimerase [Ignavibacteria bacterium GWB2_35_12]|nr:MAG: ribulose-phosphate 3-epimerase [Ignavibacteria bacterium GWA2_35_8]OGU41377.1 MAG: ribulose-phosphate 3-epimerase [Ignavibacteria bacterium GWB2_35_12]OGU95056.1 MAG: ribulose-phosphate 3-epimerase [Ignavibacteria bacterium RIFOXYA2_FULL_35_10]OGV19446.1 MAG: ribulose-phosphate 3-epimerase [Ignavibacteria bacterium RIFOXYC2_FULL_35_21]
MKRQIKIAPSLLSANFANLADDVKKCEKGGADILHCDIMDGHFVPNITIGPLIVRAIKPITKLPLNCHLMIEEPEKYIDEFVNAGADYISIHVECQKHLHRTLSLIKSYNIKAGIALNPLTPLDYAFDAAEYCDFILLMSVNPGFGGQKFIKSTLKKCETLTNFLNKNKLEHIDIEVDGGIKIDNVADIVSAGANMLVSGSGVFEGDVISNIKQLRANAETAVK